ncbi:hypothetical protein [Flavonifractor plautii]|uniref:Branched-chain amino acid transport system carrier protein n=1 Tax=Flavonifractor plautii TaxID=292800 RepID=A0AAW6CDY6_FLAPL|nr:hypothetical protein [Flavonifractor plautii]MDB7927952.1 hypothetical protein [Flavonifractor plautii]MDB7933208.1 hypothetical protein [Flavonifractor plautii]MDB7937778.1 hypothetical protein [Flavonifractor plautii]
MGKEKMRIGLLASLAGALLAYLIGSGTASGQESMQYFTSWGSVGGTLTVMVINAVVMFCTFMAYTYAGRHGTSDLAGVCEFYCGKVVGKLFTAFAWIFNTCCFFFMISGFGSTLNQQWGLPLWAGYLIAVALAVGTAVMGLQGIVNIIGKIGPVVVTFLFLLGVIAAFRFFPHIPDGIVLIKSGQVELLQAGANPVLAGLSFGGCSILLVAAYMASIGKKLAAYKKKYTIILCAIGALAITVTVGILGLCHLGNVEQSATAAIPNLLIANDIFGAASSILGPVFAIIILLSIYSTFCPMLWTCVSTIIKDEKSFKYKLTCILSGVGVFIVDLFIPYETLVNVIMTYCGYTGSVVFIVLTIRWIMVSRKDKLATASGKVELS